MIEKARAGVERGCSTFSSCANTYLTDDEALDSVRMSFKNYPTVHFRLKKEIDVQNEIKNEFFAIERRYHSGGILTTDIIQCKVKGITRKQNTYTQSRGAAKSQKRQHTEQRHQQQTETTVKINGIACNSDKQKVKICLGNYGELLSEL